MNPPREGQEKMMKENKSNLYEGMFILSAVLSDDARQKALDRIIAEITSHGGEICKIHDLGRRKLAYEINDHREGVYHLLYFRINPAAITELWHEFNLHEDLVRFITLHADSVRETLEYKTLVEQ